MITSLIWTILSGKIISACCISTICSLKFFKISSFEDCSIDISFPKSDSSIIFNLSKVPTSKINSVDT